MVLDKGWHINNKYSRFYDKKMEFGLEHWHVLIYHNRQNVAQQFTEQRKGGRKWLNAFHFIGEKKKIR